MLWLFRGRLAMVGGGFPSSAGARQSSELGKCLCLRRASVPGESLLAPISFSSPTPIWAWQLRELYLSGLPLKLRIFCWKPLGWKSHSNKK